ncbi:MAG: 16S rRNA (cytosine(1402)-N(4))-methyltransferase RsmH [Chlorobium sp.]|jgi:16S rRNA (cytosine1402-N4)-methyltransferase|nr:16S rRNA (cytosine(1402)-N(4))-methyltransferase RsmH [Chlorobium sp.]
MVQERFHDPVLVAEIVAFLVRKPGIYVDATLGGGGHSVAILHALFEAGYGDTSLLIGIDQDDAALREASERLSMYKAGLVLVKGNFQDIEGIINRVCREKGVDPLVAGILLDLGVSSFQIDTPERGFSYLRDGALDMRMDSGASLTACDIVNNYEERELARLFYRYGEEPRSRSIARAIVAYRQTHGSVRGTQELAAIIRNNAYGGEKVIKTLSRVFQALRIEVNGELDVLGRAIDGGINCLDGHGRMAVISYHSLEDRIVKQAFAEKAKSDWGPKGVGLREPLAYGEIVMVTRKPLIATPKEIELNSRARSAKLRVIEKIPLRRLL